MTGRTIVLDAEGLSALVRRERRAWEVMHGALTGDVRVVLPASVLTEVMTGRPSDAAVWHTVNRLPVHDIDTTTAARAGTLREHAASTRRKKRDLSMDALVAATALAYLPATIVTSDPDDIRALTQGADVSVVPL
ncbi:MAG: twitching motility protein PilT [Micrococcales bacterium]|nr:twitching motility protein PilT [Micrococcales bacterium]MCL2668811.1 twitching motility protein PilT [Micrococcales bacterium]